MPRGMPCCRARTPPDSDRRLTTTWRPSAPSIAEQYFRTLPRGRQAGRPQAALPRLPLRLGQRSGGPRGGGQVLRRGQLQPLPAERGRLAAARGRRQAGDHRRVPLRRPGPRHVPYGPGADGQPDAAGRGLPPLRARRAAAIRWSWARTGSSSATSRPPAAATARTTRSALSTSATRPTPRPSPPAARSAPRCTAIARRSESGEGTLPPRRIGRLGRLRSSGHCFPQIGQAARSGWWHVRLSTLHDERSGRFRLTKWLLSFPLPPRRSGLAGSGEDRGRVERHRGAPAARGQQSSAGSRRHSIESQVVRETSNKPTGCNPWALKRVFVPQSA